MIVNFRNQFSDWYNLTVLYIRIYHFFILIKT
jgi:hypothetical protein